jgi:uncharacterized protein
MDTQIPLERQTLVGGAMWSRVLSRGQGLCLVDTTGKAAVAALFYNAHAPLERYNMADTLKAQHTAHLTRGHVLYSDMGRVLVSVVADDCGWHDTFTGHMRREVSRRKFGEGSYQELRNGFFRDTRSNFLIELGKHGLGRRDLVPNVNFFVKVATDEQGALRWASPQRPGQSVTLRAEMDTLVVLSNTPHPLDPATRYAPPPVELELLLLPAPAADDPCRCACPENGRGFALTESYQL